MGIIYIAKNKINDKSYIGKTKFDINRRKHEHLRGVLKETPKCIFHRAIKKYGEDNFSWEIIETCDDSILSEREMFYIYKYKTYIGFADCNGYNMSLGGDGGDLLSDHPNKQDIYERISKANSGENNFYYRMSIDERNEFVVKYKLGAANPMFGKSRSEDFKNYMSKIKSGTNNSFYGKKHTEETKIIMSKNSKGKNSGSVNTNYGKIGPLNHISKKYVITLPSSETFVIIGYTLFIEWYEKETGIHLYVQLLGGVASGRNKSHRNILCEYYDESKHSEIKIKNFGSN